MQTLSDIRALLQAHGIHPKHRFGQNFLHDQNLIRKLVEAAALRPGELVLEVGPGTGALTEALLQTGAEVIACEIDSGLADVIQTRLGDRMTLIHGDALASKHAIHPALIKALGDRPFKLVANLPYNIASPLIVNLLVDHPGCRLMAVTVQKEVADRLTARPATGDYGPLTIVTRTFASVERIATVPPSCFWPQPEITSAMVRIERRPREQGADIDDPAAFARFVTKLFTQRRKQLGTVFGRSRTYPAAIQPEQRPEELDIDQVLALYRAMA